MDVTIRKFTTYEIVAADGKMMLTEQDAKKLIEKLSSHLQVYADTIIIREKHSNVKIKLSNSEAWTLINDLKVKMKEEGK